MRGIIRRLFAHWRRVPAPLPITLPSALAPSPTEPVPDPYRERWALLESLLSDLDAVLGPQPPAPSRRVLFFSTTPTWTDLSLLAAVVLTGRGAHVDFAWMPHPDVEDKPLSADELARLTASGPAARHPRLRVINLLQLAPVEPTPEMRAAAEVTAYTNAQYIMRREEIDLAPGSPARAAYEFRLARDLRTMTALAALLRDNRYDQMVTINGWVLEFAAAFRLAELVGLPCATIEYHDRKYCIHAWQNVSIICQDTSAAWRADAPHVYTPDRDRRVRHILSGRATGDWAEYIWRCQTAPPAPAEELLRQLGLEPDKPLALLCANVAHDSVVLGRTRAFPSMAAWLRFSIDLFAARPEWQLVIRAHPAERLLNPDESVESIVRAHRPNGLPPNVRLVLPGDPFNTYTLMSVAHAGLVYCSTTGLEMACSGLPVVVAALAHYSDKGFTRDANSPAEYAAGVEAALSGPARIPQRQAELARCYLDLYFNALPFAFPWSWADGTGADLREWPVRRVLSPEGETKFGRTFDFLAGLPVPIEERLRAVA